MAIRALVLCFLFGSSLLYSQWSLVSVNMGATVFAGGMRMEQIDGTFYLCGVQSGLFTSPDGVVWTRVSTGLPRTTAGGFTIYGAVRGVVKFNGKLYALANGAGSVTGGTFVKMPSDTVWTKLSNGLTGTSLSGTSILALDDRIIIATGGGFYKLLSGDTTWSISNTGIPAFNVAQSLAFHDGIVHTYMSGIQGSAGTYSSTDKGATWVKDSGFWSSSIGGSNYAFLNGKIYFAATDGVYIRTAPDTGWTRSITGLATNAQNVTHLLTVGNRVYAGTSSGVYFTDNDGASWTADNEGLGAIPFAIQGLAVKGEDLFAYMTITGVFKKAITTSAEEIHSVPDEFTLLQNYPNPFNPSTNIRFSIPEAGNVRVEIFTVTGEKITELFAGYLEGGLHQMRWSGVDVSGGMYIYRVTYNNNYLSGKMLLLK